MSRKGKRRGISVGTILMVLITCAVVYGMATVLPRLAGDTVIDLNALQLPGILSLGDAVPELGLNDIPIRAQTTTPPAAIATPVVTAPSAPTMPPVQVTPVPVTGGSFTITFGGTITIDNTLRQAAYFNEAKSYDFYDVLSLIKTDMNADCTVVSLENIINDEGKLSNVVTVTDVLPMLTTAGVDVVSLGFANAYDQGLAGLIGTVEAVHGRGMAVVGAFANENEAGISQQIMTLGGVKVAVLHYTDALSSKGRNAIKKDGATYAVSVDAVSDGADAILKAAADARASGAQVVIVSLNWGDDNATSPTKKQVAFAQQLADAGVDVIVGSGSDAVQPAVWLDGKRADGSTGRTLCVYSLGSLLNSSRTNKNVAGMLLRLRLTVGSDGSVKFDEASYVPTYIWRYRQDGRYYYRVVAADQPSPDGMDDDQTDARERAFSNVKKYLGNDPALTLRQK